MEDNDVNDDDDNNNNNIDNDKINNKINDVIDEFNKDVLPGLQEVLPTTEATVQQSTHEKREVLRLTFLQTQHLESKHNLMSQGHKEDTYRTDKATVVAYFISKYSLSQQYILEKGLKKIQ